MAYSGSDRPGTESRPYAPTSQPAEVRERVEARNREMRMGMPVMMGGSVIATAAGLAAVTLSILGLLGVAPGNTVSAALICAGSAIYLKSMSAAPRFLSVSYMEPRAWAIMSGMTTGIFGGLTGLILGILALVAWEPAGLIGAGGIVLGATLLVASPVTVWMSNVTARALGIHVAEESAAHKSLSSVASLQAIFGACAIVLSIIGLVTAPNVLLPLAILAIGGGILASGAVLSGRLFNIFRHQPTT